MAAEIIDGKKISRDIRRELAEEISRLKEKTAKIPALAVILVGSDPASAIYVKNKNRACEQVGITSFTTHLPEEISEADLVEKIESLNKDPEINGILVQLPLPDHISKNSILEAINPEKDVDGFHPLNAGRLSIGNPILPPCTSAGIMELFDRTGIPLKGKDVTMVGWGNLVGKPAKHLLLQREATVTVCHIETRNIEEKTRRADVVVIAIGVPEFLKSSMVKKGAVVIDVGINRTEKGLVGDVDFEEVSKKASYITPVPGGVGPMTIAMLLKNTLTAFKIQNGCEK